jgi:DNA-binding beta-propeller fold protein YncE
MQVRSLLVLSLLVAAAGACVADVTPQQAPASDVTADTEGALGGAACASAAIDGRRLLVAIEDGGAVTLDPRTGAVLHRSSTGPNAFGAIYSQDGGRAFVTDKSAGTLSEIDRESGAVLSTISVGNTPQQPALALDGRMYIPLSGEAAVAVVDASSSSLSLLRKIQIGTGTKPHIVSLSPDGKTLWVTVQGIDAKVVSINITATGEDAPKEYRYNLVPRVIDADNGNGWFTAHHSTGLHRVKLADGTVDTPYMDVFGDGSTAEKQIEGVDASADGSLLAITHEGRKVAVVLDTNAGGRVEKSFETQTLSNKPYWVTFDPSNDVIYVSIPGSGTVQAFATTGCSNAPLWTANVGGKPKRMAVTTAGDATPPPDTDEDDDHVVYFGRQEVQNGALKSALNRKPHRGEHVTLRFFAEEVASFVEGPYALATQAHLFVRFRRGDAFVEMSGMPRGEYMQRGPYTLWEESSADVELDVPANADRVEVFAYFDRTSWNGSTCYFGYDIMECPDTIGIDGAYVSNFGSNFRIGVQ